MYAQSWWMQVFAGWLTLVCPWVDVRLECLPIAWETGVQSQVKSYQRLKIWYLMPSYLTFSIISCGWRVSGAIQGKKKCFSLQPSVIAIEKETFRLPSTMVNQQLCVCVCVKHMFKYIIRQIQLNFNWRKFAFSQNVLLILPTFSLVLLWKLLLHI